MYFTFSDRGVFWYIFSATMLFLISYAILNEDVEDEEPFWTYLFYGILSGILLFAVFWTGFHLMQLIGLPIEKSAARLYRDFSPDNLWHYIIMLLIIIPGEELFWRGFVQKRLMRFAGVFPSILIASLLYASVSLYSGEIILPLAALIGGLFWGFLYVWKRSIPMLIVSHLIFDVFLFLLFPLV
ncbi:CPBP family intramembrane metalloprotease [Bacillus mesophilum]|uniref:CPBP family intramembrane metalloprotease n=2 Tax=Bacillus mesophilum TaxID=1071718 RepID=A0A7V7RR10_9BACI|nr:CPBP family intramembrane metalloprotease [Bacillus mesophilum]